MFTFAVWMSPVVSPHNSTHVTTVLSGNSCTLLLLPGYTFWFNFVQPIESHSLWNYKVQFHPLSIYILSYVSILSRVYYHFSVLLWLERCQMYGGASLSCCLLSSSHVHPFLWWRSAHGKCKIQANLCNCSELFYSRLIKITYTSVSWFFLTTSMFHVKVVFFKSWLTHLHFHCSNGCLGLKIAGNYGTVIEAPDMLINIMLVKWRCI